MKISKALKLKNRLAGEIRQLGMRMTMSNVTRGKMVQAYNSAEILEEMRKRIVDIADVKAAVATANAGAGYPSRESLRDTAAWKIFYMAELKGLSQTLSNMDTTDGVTTHYSGDGTPYEEPIRATLKRADVDGAVKQLDTEISRLQDDLDTFNAVSDLKMIDGIEV